MARTQKAPAIQGQRFNVVKIKLYCKQYHQQNGEVTTKEKTPVKYIQDIQSTITAQWQIKQESKSTPSRAVRSWQRAHITVALPTTMTKPHTYYRGCNLKADSYQFLTQILTMEYSLLTWMTRLGKQFVSFFKTDYVTLTILKFTL